jgi:hypothetical protein
MRFFIRIFWVLTTLGLYLASLNNSPSPEVKLYAFLLAPLFALPLPAALLLLKKEVLRLR